MVLRTAGDLLLRIREEPVHNYIRDEPVHSYNDNSGAADCDADALNLSWNNLVEDVTNSNNLVEDAMNSNNLVEDVQDNLVENVMNSNNLVEDVQNNCIDSHRLVFYPIYLFYRLVFYPIYRLVFYPISYYCACFLLIAPLFSYLSFLILAPLSGISDPLRAAYLKTHRN